MSRTVAQTAANQSGVGADTLKKMLPMLAMAVAGYMAKQRAGGGAGQPTQTQAKAEAGGGLSGLLGGLLGGRGGRGREEASHPCSISTVTATPLTTSCEWQAGRSAKRVRRDVERSG